MKDSRLKAFLEPLTPEVVKRALHPGMVFRDWKRRLGDRLVECKVEGLTIRLGVSTEMERFRARTFSTKEPETLAWLNANLRPDDVLFDVGANIGLYSLYAAKRCGAARVYAFEPESQNYARLCRNVFLNEATNIVACNLAVCGETGFGFFDVSSPVAGSALHGMVGFATLDPSGKPPIMRQGVGTVTLDTLVGKYGVAQPTLMKVDVDGVEEKIFEQAENVLSNPALRSVLVEINLDPHGPSPIEARLLRHGFRFVEKSDWTGRFGPVESKNYIFSRSP